MSVKIESNLSTNHWLGASFNVNLLNEGNIFKRNAMSWFCRARRELSNSERINLLWCVVPEIIAKNRKKWKHLEISKLWLHWFTSFLQRGYQLCVSMLFYVLNIALQFAFYHNVEFQRNLEFCKTCLKNRKNIQDQFFQSFWVMKVEDWYELNQLCKLFKLSSMTSMLHRKVAIL